MSQPFLLVEPMLYVSEEGAARLYCMLRPFPFGYDLMMVKQSQGLTLQPSRSSTCGKALARALNCEQKHTPVRRWEGVLRLVCPFSYRLFAISRPLAGYWCFYVATGFCGDVAQMNVVHESTRLAAE